MTSATETAFSLIPARQVVEGDHFNWGMVLKVHYGTDFHGREIVTFTIQRFGISVAHYHTVGADELCKVY